MSQQIFQIFVNITKTCMKMLVVFVFLLFLVKNTSAIDLPFTDVQPSDSYYDAIIGLYDRHIISDDGSGLFHPNDLMDRDFYVSLATTIGCKECLTPSTEELSRYAVSPFVDLQNTNPYYYCIAYAADNDITQGYNIDPYTGKTSCDNGQEYTSSPFCENNKISRIEAVSILLRRANLWDDTKNSGNFFHKETFSDVSNYWYGYAQKGLEIGILNKKSDNSIGQDEKITRGEFAIMAAKILDYTQCNNIKKDNTIASYIEIRNENDKPVPTTIFTE